MATDRLWNSLTFTNVPNGGSVALPHGLVNNNGKKVPDFGWVVKGGFTAVADDTNVTVTNNTGALASTDVLVCSIHSLARVFGGSANLSVKPVWIYGSAGITGGSGSPSNLVVWTTTKTWADTYAEIQALTGPVICLVQFDPIGPRTMTNNGGDPTNLWNVQLVAFQSPGTVLVNVEDGFALGLNDNGFAALNSVAIQWQFDCTSQPIVNGDPVALYLDGGQVGHNLGAFCFVTPQIIGQAKNEARLIGTGGTALVQLTSSPNSFTLLTGAVLAPQTFIGSGAQTITVSLDASGEIQNPYVSDVTPTYTRLDDAQWVYYDDGLVNPQLGAENVQGAIDRLKGASALIVWRTDQTWAEVYSQIFALPSSTPIIVLVATDGTTPRVMTNNGGDPTALNNVLFVQTVPWGTSNTFLNQSTINVDEGFVLAADPVQGSAIINSQNIVWVFSTDDGPVTIDPATPGFNLFLFLDGGYLTCTTNPGFVADWVSVALIEGASIGGADGGVASALMRILDNNQEPGVNLRTGAVLGDRCFIGDKATPMFVYTDGSIRITDGAFQTNIEPDYRIEGEAGAMLLSFGNLSISTAATLRYLDPGYNQGTAGTTLIGVRVPCGGLLRKLSVQFNATDVSNEDIKCEVYVNDANTGISVILPSNAVGGGADLDHSAVVVAGDLVSIAVTRTDVLIAGNLQIAAAVELYGITA